MNDRSGVIRLADAETRVPGRAGGHSVSCFARPALEALLALAPRVTPTESTAHDRDEVYVIVRGRGIFVHDGKRDPFESGDLLYVAAGVEHRFVDYAPDLAVWVLFYGPSAIPQR